MKKTIFIAISIFLLSIEMKSQLLQTYTGDNYSGINGVLMQPASLADSRYRFDVLLVGGQFGFSRNYGAYDPDLLGNFPLKPSHYRKSKGRSYYYGNLEYSFLSFMITLSPKDALGFTKRTRSITNLDGLNPDLALLLQSGFDAPTLLNTNISNDKLSYQYMKYKETAFTYSRVLMDEGDRFMKVGGTVKILNGVEAMYLYNKNVDVQPGAGQSITTSNSPFSYGYSRSKSDDFNNKLALGFDLGLVYEFRPDYASYLYDMDGKKGLIRRDLNKYKFKIGASLLDVGRIKYNKTDNSGDFIVDKAATGLTDVKINKADQINTYINSNFQKVDSSKQGETFKMTLPTALSIQADYYWRYNVYFGYMGYLPIWMKSNKEKVHNVLTNVLSARYENKKFAVAIPVSFVRNGQVNAGLNIRYNTITIGTTNLSSYFVGKRKIYDVNIYASFRYYMAYKGPKDMDGDKVSDERDECPTNPGPLSLNGCPDSDLDGLPDYKDICPEDPGPIKLNGCPDIDGDGILDYLDACPTQKGLGINTGCPDTDLDGILDVADRCPLVPGIKENNGCPEIPVLCCADSDGDGILDQFDDCPEVFGQLENKGCPLDSNSRHPSKLKSKQGLKPGLQGSKDSTLINGGLNGMDPFDSELQPNSTQKESLSPAEEKEQKLAAEDLASQNPVKETAGSKTAKLKETSGTAEGKEQKLAAKDLASKKAVKESANSKTTMDPRIAAIEPLAIVYFAKNSFRVNPEYFAGLNQVTDSLLQNKALSLLILGHTDMDGNAEYNLELSRKRSNAVKKYILNRAKGKIDEKRTEILFYGENKPVTSSADEKAKGMNRRVELRIMLEAK